jgi:hypothetical protein
VKKIVLYGLPALVFAVLAAALPDRLIPPDDNYRMVSTVMETVRLTVLVPFRLALGAAAGLALASGLASLARDGASRRAMGLLLFVPVALGLVAASGVLVRGAGSFPSGGTLAERHHWALFKLGRTYAAAVAWGAASPAVRAACGEAPRFAPAPGTRNAVRIDTKEWTFTFTLDVEGEKGSGRLALSGVLPLEPEGARVAIATALLTAGGVPAPLDSAGNAVGR